MADKTYFERQAAVCERLAKATSDRTIAERFRQLAADYRFRAEAAEDDDGFPSFATHVKPSADGDEGHG